MKFIAFTLLTYLSLSFASEKPNCNVNFSGFSTDMRSGANRINRMVKRKLKKKGYTFYRSKEFAYELNIAELMFCADDQIDDGLFSKYPYGFHGNFKNLETGKGIDISDEQDFGLFAELTNFKFRKMVKKAITKIPHCK